MSTRAATTDNTGVPAALSLQTAATLSFGPFLLDRAGGRLLRDGVELEIAPKHWRLLDYLAARPGVLVASDELLDGVWGHRFVSDAAIKVAVNGLRGVLGESAKQPRWVQTVSRRGYRFSADVRPGPGHALEAPATATEPAPALPGNLPPARGPLLGRADDLARLHLALGAERLVCLTGPGGVGKSRLALAGATFEPPADGVWLLRLDDLADNQPLATTLARLLGMADAVGRSAQALARALAPLRLRLLLDNAEHLADDLAPQLAAWLQAAPGLQVLVTSQRPLRIAGELVMLLAPLPVPAADASDAEIAANPAVSLMAQRVRLAMPHWQSDAATRAELAAIARGLDGLPLALELAAARIPLLGAAGVRDALGDRLQMLTRGAADAPQRHRTLRAALEWSVSLLPPGAERVLERLSVFSGGFTVKAAQAVAAAALPVGDAWAVLDALELLHDLALVVTPESHTRRPDPSTSGGSTPPRHSGPPPRLRVFDSVRLFAAERLALRGQAAAARAAHEAWLLALFEAAEAQQLQQAEVPWLAPLEPEADNLQTAMTRGLAALHTDPSADQLARLAGLMAASTPFCLRMGLKQVATAWLHALRATLAMAATPPLPEALSARLDAATAVLGAMGQLPAAEVQPAAERALPWLRAAGERLRLLYLLNLMGHVQLRFGTQAQAEGTLAEMRGLLRPDSSVYERRLVPWLEAMLARERGDLATCGAFWAQMLAQSRALGDTVEAWKAAWGGAQILYLQGRLDDAIAQLDLAVDEVRAAGRLRANGIMAAQAVVLRLARGADAETLRRLHEALHIVQAEGLFGWSLADAIAWVPLWQGRTADALQIQAWADSLLAARGEQRHPVFARLRAAFAERTAGLAGAAPSGVTDEWTALQLALAPAGS